MLILLVEDDRDLREALTTLLTKSGHMVTPLQNPHTALTMLNQRQFQLAVIDLGLPGMDGLELIRALRQRNFEIPVLVITARAATNERITGLDAGADDYLTKPFETSEFEARIRALLRRTYGTHNNETRMGQISFHPHLSIVTIENSSIELSGSEYSLLKLLCKNTGKVVSKERISSQERIAGAQIGAKVQGDKLRSEAEQHAEGVRIGVDVAKHKSQLFANGLKHASTLDKQPTKGSE